VKKMKEKTTIEYSRAEFLGRLADRDVARWQREHPGVIYTKPPQMPKWLTAKQ